MGSWNPRAAEELPVCKPLHLHVSAGKQPQRASRSTPEALAAAGHLATVRSVALGAAATPAVLHRYHVGRAPRAVRAVLTAA